VQSFELRCFKTKVRGNLRAEREKQEPVGYQEYERIDEV
jgi:hypothetical protein